MTSTTSTVRQDGVEGSSISSRDWIILPVVSILTAGALLGCLEITARKILAVPRRSKNVCLITNDHTTGFRAIPNSICPDKNAEGFPTQYRFDNCGYRTDMDCHAPKAPDTYRIVMLGSSYSEGLYIDREKTFAGLLPKELAKRTGHKIELYNEGINWGTPARVLLNFEQALDAEPNMILWPLTPWDIENVAGLSPDYTPADPDASALLHSPSARPQPASRWIPIQKMWSGVIDKVQERLRLVLLVRHFVYQSHSTFMKNYLMLTDASGFLAANPDAAWQKRLRKLDTDIAAVEVMAKTAGVPLVITQLPNRAQAGMIARGDSPAGFSPYAVGEELRSIVERHGGIYLDVLRDFENNPNTDELYFPVDGHMNELGHAKVASVLAKELTAASSAPLMVAAAPTTSLQGNR